MQYKYFFTEGAVLVNCNNKEQPEENQVIPEPIAEVSNTSKKNGSEQARGESVYFKF